MNTYNTIADTRDTAQTAHLSTHAQTMAAQPHKTGLLDLPTELRVMIWEDVLRKDTAVPSDVVFAPDPLKLLHAPFSLACRTIYKDIAAEAQRLLLTPNLISFVDAGELYRIVNTAQPLALTRLVTVSIGHTVVAADPLPLWQTFQHVHPCLIHLRHLPNLRELHLPIGSMGYPPGPNADIWIDTPVAARDAHYEVVVQRIATGLPNLPKLRTLDILGHMPLRLERRFGDLPHRRMMSNVWVRLVYLRTGSAGAWKMLRTTEDRDGYRSYEPERGSERYLRKPRPLWPVYDEAEKMVRHGS